MTAKRFETFIIVIIIGIIGVIYAFTQKPSPIPPPADTQINQTAPLTFEYQGEDGRNALELLKSRYTVETESFEFGEFVTSINGIPADSRHFWAMYVNGQMSQVGASAYATNSSDTIRWQLEEIK